MDLETAILTALDYENRVCGVYADALAAVDDPSGHAFLERMLKEEQAHVRYLEARLLEWRSQGRVQLEVLGTLLPAALHSEKRLQKRFTGRSLSATLDHLRRALAVETETGAFYQGLLTSLPPEDRALFAPFAAIEAAHYDHVQTQIDTLSDGSCWYGFGEFSVEVG